MVCCSTHIPSGREEGLFSSGWVQRRTWRRCRVGRRRMEESREERQVSGRSGGITIAHSKWRWHGDWLFVSGLRDFFPRSLEFLLESICSIANSAVWLLHLAGIQNPSSDSSETNSAFGDGRDYWTILATLAPLHEQRALPPVCPSSLSTHKHKQAESLCSSRSHMQSGEEVFPLTWLLSGPSG